MLERNTSLDIIRAFAIFLVVLGHSLQMSISDFDDDMLFKTIYSFHMPLFIFLSGFLSYQPNFKKTYVSNKLQVLIVPYLSWMILTASINQISGCRCFIDQIKRNLLYPDNGLWYLWILFWMQIALFFSSKLSRIYAVFIMILLIFILFLFVRITKVDNIFGIKTFIFLFPYFILGWLSKRFKKLSAIFFKTWYLVLPLFVLGVFSWHRIDLINFQGITFSPLTTLLYKFIVGVFGVITTFGFFYTVKIVHSNILYIGKNTLSIYAINFIIISYLSKVIYVSNISIKYYFFIVVFSIGILYICLFIDYILKKSKYLSITLLGIKNKPNP